MKSANSRNAPWPPGAAADEVHRPGHQGLGVATGRHKPVGADRLQRRQVVDVVTDVRQFGRAGVRAPAARSPARRLCRARPRTASMPSFSARLATIGERSRVTIAVWTPAAPAARRPCRRGGRSASAPRRAPQYTRAVGQHAVAVGEHQGHARGARGWPRRRSIAQARLPGSPRRPPAVDHQVGAGHVAGRVGGQKRPRRAVLVRARHAAERRACA